MWNRADEQTGSNPGPNPGPGPSASGGRALLGASIAVQGNLAGKEDLLIEGRFEGEIRVPGHQVTIGRQGNVEAEIRARRIVVEGRLAGNIVAEEQAVVRASGRVQGDIKAPKVALDEGCQFKGRIDMEPGDPKAESPKTLGGGSATSEEPKTAKEDKDAASDKSGGADEGGKGGSGEKPSSSGADRPGSAPSREGR